MTVQSTVQRSNPSQQKAIETTKGPLLIIAGPGTGKTYTLVQRAIHLIQQGVKPESIMMATFTEKAAKELITRITNALAQTSIKININEMYIGTFHSICLRLLKENIDHTDLGSNYRVIDDFDQIYMLYQSYFSLRDLPDFNAFASGGRQIDTLKRIATLVNMMREELVSADDLINDNDPELVLIGEFMKKYDHILKDEHLLDFTSIQTKAYQLLREQPQILKKLQNQIQYLMIDEYQDTNYIQEQLVFMIAGDQKNICVVGDDDQGLYRFRGATIRNILEFPRKFKSCQQVQLDQNYRSSENIVDFYNQWMSNPTDFDWQGFRFPKTIQAVNTKASPSVLKFIGNTEKLWHEGILQFIKKLQAEGKNKKNANGQTSKFNLNQIAFLFRSVTNQKAVKLAKYLEANGIPVYSPRSEQFFDRDEIKLMIGILLISFPCYELRTLHFDTTLQKYYQKCQSLAVFEMNKAENQALKKFIDEAAKKHDEIIQNSENTPPKNSTTDYNIAGYLYSLFKFSIFEKYLESDLNSNVSDVRPVRNLALFTELIGKFEYLHHISVLSGKWLVSNMGKLMNSFLRMVYLRGIGEYEDDSEYAPKNCVSFLTIHQSKGMEFPIVFVDSLDSIPREPQGADDLILQKIEARYFKRKAFEPRNEIKYFDFWRLFYTAFSRAQNLLVLTTPTGNKSPSISFIPFLEGLPTIHDPQFKLNQFEFEQVKDVDIKESYSFTSDITVYQNCALQYKFFKELGFVPVRIANTIFGILVHQTIENMHKEYLQNQGKPIDHIIDHSKIEQWFQTHLNSIQKKEKVFLANEQKMAALKQVKRYFDSHKQQFHLVQETEFEVNLVKDKYILQGKIDLISGDQNTVEIIDFKAQEMPKGEDDLSELYRQQLQVYAHLVEQRLGKKVSKVHIHYTGVEDNQNPRKTYMPDPKDVQKTIQVFDQIVDQIIDKRFDSRAIDQRKGEALPTICRNCDFRHYCNNRDNKSSSCAIP